MTLIGRAVRNKYLEKYIRVLASRQKPQPPEPEPLPLLGYMDAYLNAAYRAKKQFQKTGVFQDGLEEVELKRRQLANANVFDRDYLSKACSYWTFAFREFWTHYLDFKTSMHKLPSYQYSLLTRRDLEVLGSDPTLANLDATTDKASHIERRWIWIIDAYDRAVSLLPSAKPYLKVLKDQFIGRDADMDALRRLLCSLL